MKYIVVCLYMMSVYGLFVGYYGAGLLAFLSAIALSLADNSALSSHTKLDEGSVAITDDDVDPRIKS